MDHMTYRAPERAWLCSYHFEVMGASIAAVGGGVSAFVDDRGTGLTSFVDGNAFRGLGIGGGFFGIRRGGLGGMVCM